MIEGLLASLFGLFFFALIGHGMWLCGANLLRSVFGLKKSEPVLTDRDPVKSPSDDALKAEECVQRLTRGSFLEYDDYCVVRDKLETAARRAKVFLPNRLPKRERIEALSGTSTDASKNLVAPANESPVHGLRDNQGALELPPVVVAPVVQPSHSIHALEKDYATQPLAPTAPLAKASRKAVGEMLQEFLNEKNIHWGELLSGVLIVGSAVGLIFSLRWQLSQIIPMFSAVIFFLATAAIHFAGFYTLGRWKLPSTSRGLLLIGSLLIPITFLATALLADHGGSASILEPGFIALMIVGGGACGALVYYGARQLLPSQPITWTVGIMGSSLALGIINRSVADSTHPMQLSLFGCLALIGLAYVVVRNVLLPRVSSRFQPAQATAGSHAMIAQLKLYGTTLFALIVAMGLLVLRARELFDTLLPYSIPIAGLGLLTSAIGCGIGTLKELSPERDAVDLDRPDATPWWHVLSTAILILGSVFVVAAAFFAKDSVQLVVGIALLGGLANGGLALLFKQPSLTAVSALGLSSAVLLIGHRISGNLAGGPLTMDALLSVATHGLTGAILLVLAIAWGLGGWWLRLQTDVGGEKSERKPHASFSFSEPLPLSHWLVMFVAAGLLSFMAILVSGYGAFTTTAMNSMCLSLAVLGCCAFAGLLVGHFRQDRLPMFLSSGLLFLICTTLLRSNNPVAFELGVTTWEIPWRVVAAMLSHAAIVTGARLLLSSIRSGVHETDGQLVLPTARPTAIRSLGITGAATASASMPLLLRWDEPSLLGWQAICLALAGVICVLQGRLQWGSVWRIVGQASLGMAIAQIFAKLLSDATPNMFVPEQCLIFAISTIALVVSAVASLPYFTRATWSGLAAWKRVDADVVCVAFVIYLIALSLRFWDTPRANLTPDACLFALSITMALMGSLLLAAFRNRRSYQFLAGILSCFATAAFCQWLAPTTLTTSTFLTLMCMAPLAIVLGFSVYDVLSTNSETATTAHVIPIAGGAPFEDLVSWGTLFAWFLITSTAYTIELNSIVSAASLTLASPLGFVWILFGILTFVVQSPLRPPVVACNRTYIASLMLVLQAPLWMASGVTGDLTQATWLALILSAVAVHAAMAGLAVRVYCAASSRRTSKVRLMDQYFSDEYRAQAVGLFGKLVETSASSVVIVSIPFALLSTDSNALRIVALAVFMSGVGLLAASSAAVAENSLRSRRARCWAIGILCWFAILLTWSSLPQMDTMLLATLRSMRASCVLYIASIILVAYHARPTIHDWTLAVKQSWPVMLAGGVVTGLCATWLAWQQVAPETGLASAGFDAICLALAQTATVAVLVVQALRNSWNIAEFPDQWRSNYVYFAEAIAGLAAIGLYVVFPQWFDLPLKQYWPLIILAVALAGSAIAKLLSLKNLDVLGDPMARTSLLLPIVAAIGVFVVGSSARSDLVLTLGAVFYFMMAAADGSRKLAVAGMALVNVAMFLFWHRYPSLDFLRHPQLWIIPPAASVLIASYFHRRELSAQTMTWIRYAALGAIFLSSTSEILLAGIGESLWPPMLLTVLSVLAVFMGISLQTRSFIYFGFVFLLVSTTAMVAHAQQSLGHTWPWWALGITLGIAILILFGLFEKRRNEMQQLTEKLRSWEA